MKLKLVTLSICYLLTAVGLLAETTKPAVFFANLKDGQTVTSPLKIEMGVNGMTVAPAGKVEPNTGHHHIVLDGNSIPKGEVIPMDATHLHFGKGQTETTIELPPGKHTITLQFADGAHLSYGPDLSATITVNVEAPKS
jgi:hypothetical protein